MLWPLLLHLSINFMEKLENNIQAINTGRPEVIKYAAIWLSTWWFPLVPPIWVRNDPLRSQCSFYSRRMSLMENLSITAPSMQQNIDYCGLAILWNLMRTQRSLLMDAMESKWYMLYIKLHICESALKCNENRILEKETHCLGMWKHVLQSAVRLFLVFGRKGTKTALFASYWMMTTSSDKTS